MTIHLIRRMCATAVVVISSLVAMPVMSAPDPNVRLMATLDQSPAFTSLVRWSVFRVENGVREPQPYVVYNNRHALAVRLPPGRYEAEASLASVRRSRVFDVSSYATNNIVVALD